MAQGMKRRWLPIGVIALMVASVVLATVASAGAVSVAAGFEGDDGNLADDAGAGIDWNAFATTPPLTWTGTAPYREAHATEGAYSFTGVEDAQNNGTDTVFAGGVKQDDECPVVKSGPKPPNKDDLKRAYFADATIGVDPNDKVYLALAWVRIPQNTVNASAHVGFEFNQSDEACGASSDGLVERTAGDLLVVYDFEGSSSDAPTLTLREWTTDPADSCEVGSNSPPCWGTAVNLTAGGFAEARVNTTPPIGPVTDALAPTAGGAVTNESLGTNEFGEAIIDLTTPGILDPDECFAFGKAYAVSRSSGNSAQAQMKDLAGPGEVDIKNCGSVIIRKQTVPDEDPNSTLFDYDTTGGLDDSEDATVEFQLADDGVKDYGSEVFAGSYTVSERSPGPTYALTNIDCSASSLTNGSTITIGAAGGYDAGDTTVNVTLAAEDSIDCTYTNTLQQGALVIEKRSTKTGNPLVSNAGAVFAVDGPDAGTTTDFSVTDDNTAAAPDEDATVGKVCISGLTPGTYTINETTAPSGYGDAPATQDDLTATVVADTDCTAPNTPGAGATVTFTNPPLADILVAYRDGGSDETSLTSIDCTGLGTSPDTLDGTPLSGWDASARHLNIPIDPSPRTITCTIIIDP